MSVMRERHSITVLPDSLQPDAPIRPDGGLPGIDASIHRGWDDEDVDLFDDGVDVLLLDEPELIDDTKAEQPFLPEALSEGAPAPRPPRLQRSAVQTAQTASRPNLPWGLDTNGWPRQNSRLVRLFACDPDDFVAGTVGTTWGPLTLDSTSSVDDTEHLAPEGWPRVTTGTLQMPYPSAPLEVELQAQPFHDRYTRVDIVLRSRRRWPRRYFDVASVCLTEMGRLERHRI